MFKNRTETVNSNRDWMDNSTQCSYVWMNPSMIDNECCFVRKITREFCVCCSGPDIELMEGAFLAARFLFFFILNRIGAVVC